MLLLLLFALIAGAGTAITPCVLPVLPALLSASGVGGRRRPLGIVLGLAVTFTITIVALASIAKGVGLGAGVTRTIAVVVLIAFGFVMLIPELSARLEAPLSRLARFGPKTRGTGFWTGLGVGAALGFVCAPCAGPILAAVISVSASGHTTAKVVAVAIAYVIGLSAMLLLYSVIGRRLIGWIRRRAGGHKVERALGVVLLITGVVIATNLDVRFEDFLARNTSNLPGFLTDPTRGLENSGAVQKRLADLRPESKFALRQQEASTKPVATEVGVSIPGVKTPSLSNLGAAPQFVGTEDWFNTPGDRPLTLSGLRGHVVIVDFWTYTCINCIRTLPFIEGLYKTYHRYGLEIIGVEAPEFEFEKEASNVAQAIKSDGLTYPIVQDNNLSTWNAYQNEYWPADYFIDADGNIRHTQFGEGDYEEDEAVVRQLLHDAGARQLPPPMTAHAILPSSELGTAETYLNPEREQGFSTTFTSGVHTYSLLPESKLHLNEFSLGGAFDIGSESITPSGSSAEIEGGIQAQHEYLVMTSSGNVPRSGEVLLDGRPIPNKYAGADVHNGRFTVVGQRLYSLVSFPADEQAIVTVVIPHGVSAYDFTFG
ncbi:MAG TPA: cytochrome c biogenesis protein CcdA [Solirubrobacteraceae bacterium]|nr:cytochrome c biogenesis protein CcdA [Solirubrobacteraceae bacterium]